MATIEIRRTSAEDFADVVRLLEQLWPEKALHAGALRVCFLNALRSHTQRYLSACDRDRVVGFASLSVKISLWETGLLGHVDELVVDAESRGKGIGTRLLNALVKEGRELRCSRLELDSAFHRGKAHAFYERFGFERRGLLFTMALG